MFVYLFVFDISTFLAGNQFDVSEDLFSTERSTDDDQSAISVEVSLEEPSIHEQPEIPDSPVTFQLIEEATKRGRVKLVDNRGYTFNVKRRRATATDCTSRPAGDPCRATVVQRGDSFQPSQRSHNHPAQVGAALAAIVSAKVKAKAVQDLFKPAPAIVSIDNFSRDSLP